MGNLDSRIVLGVKRVVTKLLQSDDESMQTCFWMYLISPWCVVQCVALRGTIFGIGLGFWRGILALGQTLSD